MAGRRRRQPCRGRVLKGLADVVVGDGPELLLSESPRSAPQGAEVGQSWFYFLAQLAAVFSEVENTAVKRNTFWRNTAGGQT